jgi:hypothetical protein
MYIPSMSTTVLHTIPQHPFDICTGRPRYQLHAGRPCKEGVYPLTLLGTQPVHILSYVNALHCLHSLVQCGEPHEVLEKGSFRSMINLEGPLS